MPLKGHERPIGSPARKSSFVRPKLGNDFSRRVRRGRQDVRLGRYPKQEKHLVIHLEVRHSRQDRIGRILEMQFEFTSRAVPFPVLLRAAGNRGKPGWVATARPVVNDHQASAALQVLIQYGPFNGFYIGPVGGVVDQNIRLKEFVRRGEPRRRRQL